MPQTLGYVSDTIYLVAVRSLRAARVKDVLMLCLTRYYIYENTGVDVTAMLIIQIFYVDLFCDRLANFILKIVWFLFIVK